MLQLWPEDYFSFVINARKERLNEKHTFFYVSHDRNVLVDVTQMAGHISEEEVKNNDNG